jgi:hypothetical protein
MTGIPLSPMLFVLAGDLLLSVINNAYRQGSFLPPISEDTDDTLLAMQAYSTQLM